MHNTLYIIIVCSMYQLQFHMHSIYYNLYYLQFHYSCAEFCGCKGHHHINFTISRNNACKGEQSG